MKRSGCSFVGMDVNKSPFEDILEKNREEMKRKEREFESRYSFEDIIFDSNESEVKRRWGRE